jgi:hypothetical protein
MLAAAQPPWLAVLAVEQGSGVFLECPYLS